MGLLSYAKENHQLPERPSQNLGRVDKYNSSLMVAVYTPISNITTLIMNKTVSAPFLKGKYIKDKGITDIVLNFGEGVYMLNLKLQ